MSDNLYTLFTEEFSSNLRMKLQQQGSKLRGRVSTGTHKGRQASPVNEIGAVAMKRPAGRFAPKQRTDAEFTRRWVFPIDGELDQLIDSFDELKTIVDPKSGYVTNAANAAARDWDDILIDSAFASSYIGRDAAGLTTESFDTTKFQVADNFGAAAATGLTVAKLIELKRIFRKYHVDLENDPATLVIGSQQESDLLNQTQVVSTEFNDRPVLVDGRVQRFLGFDIVVSERLDVASNTRRCIAFVKSGWYLGIWQDVANRVSIRNDLSGEPYDLYTKHSVGATRLEPGRLLEVECLDTTGADITV